MKNVSKGLSVAVAIVAYPHVKKGILAVSGDVIGIAKGTKNKTVSLWKKISSKKEKTQTEAKAA